MRDQPLHPRRGKADDGIVDEVKRRHPERARNPKPRKVASDDLPGEMKRTTRKYERVMNKRYGKGVTEAAKRRVDEKMGNQVKSKKAMREYRVKHGQYKGKYYGPDAFKGDNGMIDAWLNAGKPKDKTGFAARYSKSKRESKNA